VRDLELGGHRANSPRGECLAVGLGDEVEIATVHRALETLRAAMNWGMAQTPALFKKSPFHRFGVLMQRASQ